MVIQKRSIYLFLQIERTGTSFWLLYSLNQDRLLSPKEQFCKFFFFFLGERTKSPSLLFMVSFFCNIIFVKNIINSLRKLNIFSQLSHLPNSTTTHKSQICLIIKHKVNAIESKPWITSCTS